MIVGVCGLIGSGKDTIADYLVNIHQFRRESFANSLKDAVAAVFGWDREMLEGRSKSSREWRETRDEWWSQRLGRDITPRWILQYWGTDVIRNGFHDDMWIAAVENKLRKSTDDIVISDCRFPNEVAALRAQGGYVIRVVRGEDPEWFAQARSHLISGTPLPAGIPHASEWAWAGTDFDHVVYNDGSLDKLYSEITSLVRDLHASKEVLAA